nr:NAC domain-containing protein [Tanacetum cinerariifolium]
MLKSLERFYISIQEWKVKNSLRYKMMMLPSPSSLTLATKVHYTSIPTYYQEYGLPTPDMMMNDVIKQSESYQMFLKYFTGQIPPKKGRGKGSHGTKTADTLVADFDVSKESDSELARKRTAKEDHQVLPSEILLGYYASSKRKQETSKRWLGTSGSSEGTGRIPGVPDESIVVFATSSEGTDTKLGVPDKENVTLEANVILEWGSKQESEYSKEYQRDDEKQESEYSKEYQRDDEKVNWNYSDENDEKKDDVDDDKNIDLEMIDDEETDDEFVQGDEQVNDDKDKEMTNDKVKDSRKVMVRRWFGGGPVVVRWWSGVVHGGSRWSATVDRRWPPLTAIVDHRLLVAGTRFRLQGQYEVRVSSIVEADVATAGWDTWHRMSGGNVLLDLEAPSRQLPLDAPPVKITKMPLSGWAIYIKAADEENPLVYDPNPCNNYDFLYFDQPSQFTPPQPLSLSALRRREMITFMIESQKQFDKTQELIKINQEKLNMDFQNELNRLQEMMNLRNSNQDPPADLYDLKRSDEGDNKIDSVISTIPAREIDEFIKSGVDDLVLILKESEVTFDSNLKCSMPLDSSPSLRLDVLGESKVDIHLPFGEHLDTLSIRDREIDFNPRDIETNDLIPGPRMFDVPLGNDDSVSRLFDVTFSNPLFDSNDDYTLFYDNPLFDREFEDISRLDPLESTPVIDESSLLVTPPFASKKLSLKEVERFDPFFSLTQSGEETRVMEIPSFGFHHMPSPCPTAYSPQEVMYHFYHPHITSGDGFDPESK